MRQLLLNRPARCSVSKESRRCFHSLYHKYVENDCAGKSDGVDDDYDYRTSNQQDICFSIVDVRGVHETSQGEICHVEMGAQSK